MPETIHPAFYKAADYFDIEVRSVPGKGESLLLPDIAVMRGLIDSNTVLIAGSAPAYPHGINRPYSTDQAHWQREKNVWLHVDACVGGYMLPFLEQIGEAVPIFDFRLGGVSSISLDLHKYGYAAKGASVVLYRNSEYRKHQYYVHTSWAGGLYASPSVSGTRPGGAIAAAWAALNYLGKERYQKMAARDARCCSCDTSARSMPQRGLGVVGDPVLTVFSFMSTGSMDIYRLGDELSSLGWHLDRQLTPPSLHLTVSYGNVAFADEFIRDLALSVAKVQTHSLENISDKVMNGVTKTAAKILPERWIKKIASGSIQDIPNQKEGHSKTAALYGLAGEISGSGALDDMLLELLDVMNRPGRESFENNKPA